MAPADLRWKQVVRSLATYYPNRMIDILIFSNTDRFSLVHRDDVDPVKLIDPNLADGPWIAGGAPLRWFQHTAVGAADIDVYCKTAEQASALTEKLKKAALFVASSANADTFKYQIGAMSWTIQVIIISYFDSIKSVIHSFDLSVCQIATTGAEWVVGEHTVPDIRSRVCRLINTATPALGSRVVKYWVYGYTPTPDTLSALRASDDIRWDIASGYD